MHREKVTDRQTHQPPCKEKVFRNFTIAIIVSWVLLLHIFVGIVECNYDYCPSTISRNTERERELRNPLPRVDTDV